MNWSRYWPALIVALLLVSCGGRQEARPTPTPFSEQGVTLRAPVGAPIAISLSNLAANPALFEGAILQLRGAYQPLPRFICEQVSSPSPATWALQGDGLQANATGLDEQLRQLVDVGQEITVEGRWLRYSGPVGCGKDAPVQEVWYLSTSRVIDPNPLARDSAVVVVTFELEATPTPIPTETPTQEATETPTETATAVQTEAPPTPTYVPSPTLQPGGGTPQRGSPTPVPTPVVGTPAGSATATSAPGSGTPTLTPTATGSPSGETPTPGTATATATATRASTGGTVVEKGSAQAEDLIISRLESGNVDSREFSVGSSMALTITVAPASDVNLILTVLDPNSQIIVDGQDEAGAGEVETITNLDAPESGAYRIQVGSDSGEATDYALMVLDSDSYNFEFMGTLDMGSQRGDALAVDNDHFWFFSANDGESINLVVTPTDERDPYVELYGPNGSLLETIDRTGGGEAEELTDFPMLATGMYSVRVGEFDFEPMSYLIIVERN